MANQSAIGSAVREHCCALFRHLLLCVHQKGSQITSACELWIVVSSEFVCVSVLRSELHLTQARACRNSPSECGNTAASRVPPRTCLTPLSSQHSSHLIDQTGFSHKLWASLPSLCRKCGRNDEGVAYQVFGSELKTC